MAYKTAAFPYPVLSELDNFDHPLPEDAALYYDESNEENYIFQVELSVEDPDINEYIKNGQAEYCIQIDCPSTHLRVNHVFDSGNYKVVIPRMEVLNKVEISSYIIAKQDIPDYACNGFNQTYYRNCKFSIETGDILAIFRPYQFDTRIKKIEDSQLGDYIEFKESNSDKVSFELSGDIIYISLPKKTNKIRLSHSSLLDLNSAIIHSSFVNIALVEALYNIGKYAGKVWADSIALQLKGDPSFKEGIDYIIEEGGFITEIPYPSEIASRILGNPYQRMLEGMKYYKSIND